ncbi:MAG: divalent-cation tolerance protein CutA [Anaerolineae bacterium]|nr:divalent-cation tolerance protein CutA [Anaerolineae bacterium]
MSSDYVVVLSNAGSQEEAERIAGTLVQEFLAACVNIVPRVRSVYRWQGQIEWAEEWMMVMKTRRSLAEALIRRLRQLHSYELPEAIVLPIDGGLAEYLDWIRSNVEEGWHDLP